LFLFSGIQTYSSQSFLRSLWGKQYLQGIAPSALDVLHVEFAEFINVEIVQLEEIKNKGKVYILEFINMCKC